MHLSIRRIRSLVLLLFVSIVFIITFSAIFSKDPITSETNIAETLGNIKDLKNELDLDDNIVAEDDFTKGMNEGVNDDELNENVNVMNSNEKEEKENLVDNDNNFDDDKSFNNDNNFDDDENIEDKNDNSITDEKDIENTNQTNNNKNENKEGDDDDKKNDKSNDNSIEDENNGDVDGNIDADVDGADAGADADADADAGGNFVDNDNNFGDIADVDNNLEDNQVEDKEDPMVIDDHEIDKTLIEEDSKETDKNSKDSDKKGDEKDDGNDGDDDDKTVINEDDNEKSNKKNKGNKNKNKNKNKSKDKSDDEKKDDKKKDDKKKDDKKKGDKKKDDKKKDDKKGSDSESDTKNDDGKKKDDTDADTKGNDDKKNDEKESKENKEEKVEPKKKEIEFKLYHDGSNYRDGDDPEGKDCPVAWKWVDNKSESDIIALNVLDNLADIKRIENYKYDKSRQKLLLMSMESTSNYKEMITKKKYFDYTIDYRLDSDVPIPYTYDFFNFSKPALPTKEKGKDDRGLAAVFISNCGATNDRLEFLNELMKYTKIDSYGMCSHNKDPYEEDADESAWGVKMNTIRKYKFTLAFENSNDRDYVTEKFFQPLEAGSVPVFYGTNNIEDFAPPNSYINAKDFESAKELAEYLEQLDKNDKEYERYLEWKKKAAQGDLGENLNHLVEIRKLNSICQLLQRIKKMWINPYLTKWDRKDVSKDERACRLC